MMNVPPPLPSEALPLAAASKTELFGIIQDALITLVPAGYVRDLTWPETNCVAYRLASVAAHEGAQNYFVIRFGNGQISTERVSAWRGCATPGQGWVCIRQPVTMDHESVPGLYRYDQARFDQQDRVMAHRYVNFGKKGIPLEPPPGTPRWSDVVHAALNKWRNPPSG